MQVARHPIGMTSGHQKSRNNLEYQLWKYICIDHKGNEDVLKVKLSLCVIKQYAIKTCRYKRRQDMKSLVHSEPSVLTEEFDNF
jgi:hypothetical protein